MARVSAAERLPARSSRRYCAGQIHEIPPPWRSRCNVFGMNNVTTGSLYKLSRAELIQLDRDIGAFDDYRRMLGEEANPDGWPKSALTEFIFEHAEWSTAG